MAIIQKTINQIIGGFTEASRSSALKHLDLSKQPIISQPEQNDSQQYTVDRQSRPHVGNRYIGMQMMEKALNEAQNAIYSTYTQNQMRTSRFAKKENK